MMFATLEKLDYKLIYQNEKEVCYVNEKKYIRLTINKSDKKVLKKDILKNEFVPLNLDEIKSISRMGF